MVQGEDSSPKEDRAAFISSSATALPANRHMLSMAKRRGPSISSVPPMKTPVLFE